MVFLVVLPQALPRVLGETFGDLLGRLSSALCTAARAFVALEIKVFKSGRR
jgi:hypothetical protein